MKLKIGKFEKSVLFAIGLVTLISFMDYLEFPAAFWGFANLIGIVAAGMYYIFKKDLSEALAIAAAFTIMLHTGLEDFIYFVIGKGFPPTMDNLFKNDFIGGVANILGYNTVTPFTLTVSVMCGGVITYFVVKWLKKQKW